MSHDKWELLDYVWQPVEKDTEIRILLLEDDQTDAELTEYALREGDLKFVLRRVDSEEEFIRELETNPPHLVLSDYSVPGFDGFHALSITQKKQPDLPFIFVTGTMGEEVAIETLKSGATDYVLKTRLSRLGAAVQRAMRESLERAERKKAEDQLRQSHEQLRALSMYLQHIREEERTRIAREIHDQLGQSLTGLKIDLAWLVSRFPRELKPLLEKAKSMVSHIDETIQTVRRISTELRPGILDDIGLAAAIEWQANEFQNRTEIHCEVQNELGDIVLDQDLNTAFFRIFQETLTNIMRHAKATRVKVQLAKERENIVLRVQDNGVGITEDKINKTRSIGLLGMKERAALLGGEFKITGKPGQGTPIIVSIPCQYPELETASENENSYYRRSRSRKERLEANSGR